MALVGALAIAAAVARREPRLGRWMQVALAIGLCQAVVGIANVVTGIPVEVTGLHSALAAALVLALARAAREAWAVSERTSPA